MTVWFRRPKISEELRVWVDDCFDWSSSIWGEGWLQTVPLVLPTRTFFTARRADSAATANAVLADVKRHLRMEDVEVELVAQKELPAEYRHEYGKLFDVSGTFSNHQLPVITYSPALIGSPIRLISTLAHELMHLRLGPVADDVPGGFEAHELATDLFCILWGFGVFQIQAAEEAGWAGYLSQPTRAYAIARFIRESGQSIDTAKPYLSTRPFGLIAEAARELAANG